MSTDLVPIADIERLATMLSKSALLPEGLRGKVADIAVTVLAGRELGLSPMAALRGIHVVSGKPVLSADMMIGLVQSSGKCEFFECIESTDKIATYETKRVGARSAQRMSFTAEQATKAGLTGPNWTKYREAMLRARAKSALARDVYSDVLAGCYEEDEARDFARPAPVEVAPATNVHAFRSPEPVTVIDAEYTEAPGKSLAALLLEAASLDDLQALVPALSRIEDPSAKSELRRVYAARKKEIALRSSEPPPRSDDEAPVEAVG